MMRQSVISDLHSRGTFSPETSDDEISISQEFEDAGQPLYFKVNGGVNVCAGVPAMYDYEHWPQAGSVPPPFAPMRCMALVTSCVVAHSQGCIVPWTSSLLEPGAVDQARQISPGDLKDVFAVGSQGPASLWSDGGLYEVRARLKGADIEVMEFLDRAERQMGKNRALYISFGSLFFPILRLDLIVLLLETLLTLKSPIPFVFATAAPYAFIDPVLVDRVHASGRGLILKYAPQYAILSHPAIGWFLTHGGSNSVSESIICRVPMIMWPCIYDQPGIAAQFSQVLNIAFELLQIRTGPSVGRPTYRGPIVEGTPEAIVAEFNEVFSQLEEHAGKEKRANIVRLREEMGKHREEGGEEWKQMRRLGRLGLDE